MVSKEEVDKIAKLTAQTFSQRHQSHMLNLFIEIREKEREPKAKKMTIPEKWIQTEIVRKFHRKGFCIDPNEKKKHYDFKIDNVGIELKASGSFTYKDTKPKSNRLLNEMKSHRKDPDCWMFVTVLDKAREAEMYAERELSGHYLKREDIINTNPQWCVILICGRSIIES